MGVQAVVAVRSELRQLNLQFHACIFTWLAAWWRQRVVQQHRVVTQCHLQTVSRQIAARDGLITGVCGAQLTSARDR